jgi:hypothetical protein
MKKRIHVNQHHIRHNRRPDVGCGKPVFTVKTYKANHTANHVHINGPSTVVYEPAKPLSCGAHAWIETDAPVVLDGLTVIA